MTFLVVITAIFLGLLGFWMVVDEVKFQWNKFKAWRAKR